MRYDQAHVAINPGVGIPFDGLQPPTPGNGNVAQPVEHVAHNDKVVGSSPAIPTGRQHGELSLISVMRKQRYKCSREGQYTILTWCSYPNGSQLTCDLLIPFRSRRGLSPTIWYSCQSVGDIQLNRHRVPERPKGD